MNSSPRYIQTYREGMMQAKTDQAHKLLESCSICPRRCRVNRLNNEKGFCRVGRLPVVCSCIPHHGEEPPVSGTLGSGTIFFSYCNMRCVYCQNYHFSQQGEGDEASEEELARSMLGLQKIGCHNINLVTPTHVMPQILKALEYAAKEGLTIPIVYNTSGYELPEIIQLLDGVVDVYLVDMRYAETKHSQHYSQAPDYPRYNQAALKEMHKQVGNAKFDEQSLITQGIIVRHLVLPNNISGTETIMKFLSQEISPHTYVSLMSQYHPYYMAHQFTDINRRISKEEYQKAIDCMKHYGLENGWIQESGGLENFAGIHIKKNV